MKKSFHTPKGKEIVELVQEVGDKLDDIRTFIAQHFENSKILFENAVKFPVLSSLVQYSIDSDKTDYSGFLPENIASPTIAKESTEPDVKLQWNGTNRSLYDLFAQLTLIKTKDGKEVIGNTIKGLARFIAHNVEGMADAKTIERELEKMREPNGVEKAKRGRIELNIIKE